MLIPVSTTKPLPTPLVMLHPENAMVSGVSLIQQVCLRLRRRRRRRRHHHHHHHHQQQQQKIEGTQIDSQNRVRHSSTQPRCFFNVIKPAGHCGPRAWKKKTPNEAGYLLRSSILLLFHFVSLGHIVRFSCDFRSQKLRHLQHTGRRHLICTMLPEGNWQLHYSLQYLVPRTGK